MKRTRRAFSLPLLWLLVSTPKRQDRMANLHSLIVQGVVRNIDSQALTRCDLCDLKRSATLIARCRWEALIRSRCAVSSVTSTSMSLACRRGPFHRQFDFARGGGGKKTHVLCYASPSRASSRQTTLVLTFEPSLPPELQAAPSPQMFFSASPPASSPPPHGIFALEPSARAALRSLVGRRAFCAWPYLRPGLVVRVSTPLDVFTLHEDSGRVEEVAWLGTCSRTVARARNCCAEARPHERWVVRHVNLDFFDANLALTPVRLSR